MSFPPPTPRQARVLWFSLTTLTLVVIIGLVFIAADWLLARLSAVLLPIALALILAYILDPVVEFLVRKKIPRVWSIVLVFIMGIILSAGLIGSVVPDLVKESRKLVDVLDAKDFHLRIQDLLKKAPFFKELTTGYERSVAAAQSPGESARNPAHPHKESTNSVALINPTNNIEINVQIKAPVTTNADGTLSTNNVELTADTQQLKKMFDAPFSETIIPALAKALISFVNWIPRQLGAVTTWVEFLVGFILVPVYLFYFLLEKHGINKHWTDYLPIKESKAKEELVFVLKAINECMVVFFRGQVLVALCVGTLLAISYLLLGLNYAVLLGAVAATLGIIPYLGTITSLAIALTVAAVQFGDWAHPLSVLGIAAAVKMLEDFVISPKIIGDRSGLHPLTIIIAVMIGAKLMGGFLGALVAVPLTAVLRTLMFRYIWKKRPRKSKVAEPLEAADIAS
jgi:predicted PurR-regulated permease PerM